MRTLTAVNSANCPIFHETWKELTPRVVEIGKEHDATDYQAVWKLVKRQDKIAIGIIYRVGPPTLAEIRTIAVTAHRRTLSFSSRLDEIG